MKRKIKFHYSSIALTLLLSLSMVLSSCVPESQGRRKPSSQSKESVTDGKTNPPGSVGSLPDSSDSGSGEVLQSLKIELLHLVDPFTGTYKKKISIPKNFKGELNIAMTNIAAVQNKVLRARIYTGHDLQPLDVAATVNMAPGIIPDTQIQVLSLDFNQAPAKNLQLNYDLYDYNDYDSNPTLEPVTNNRDANLYCRGLTLNYDHTYTGTTGRCELGNDKCLYSYAKVLDQTLTYSSGGSTISNIPTLPQVWNHQSNFTVPSPEEAKQSMCLLDSMMTQSEVAMMFDELTLSGGYTYSGPYRTVNNPLWNISSAAITNPKFGIFKSVNGIGYFNSLLFPRAGRLSVQTSSTLSHMGSQDFFGSRSNISDGIDQVTGKTQYMDGCNLRVTNFNSDLNEGIGSCNVTAYIEIYYKSEGREISVAKDHTLKIQFLRKSELNFEGKEVLNSSFKSCSSSSLCANGECCFNGRCWSKDLVSYCVDQVPGNGNFGNGVSCSSDFECSSLCCSSSTGTCQPHDPNNPDAPSMCNKTAGQSCVTKDFCKPEYVRSCKKVKLPEPGVNGQVSCVLKCDYVETYGKCTDKKCIPPISDSETNFDLTDCSDAVDQ